MKFAKFLIQWHFDIERASLQGLNSRFEFSTLRKSWFNQPFKFSAICCKFLTKSLQKLKKFKEFLRNSLNFPQNFQTLFTNSRKILKHFSQKIRKVLKQLSQNESKFPAKVRSAKKKLVRSKKFAQKAHSKAYCKSCITYCWLVFACAIA